MPIAFVDDNPDKRGMRVCGIPVLGCLLYTSIHGPNLDDKPAEQRWYDGALLKLFAILMLVGETLPYFEEDERKALTKINRAIERVKLLRKMPESCD